jgi:hypothetical protein
MLTTTAYRWHIAVAHAALILWQGYIAFVAFRTGDVLGKLIAGLGAETGGAVSFFLASHRWWIVVPLAFVVLAAIAIQRLETRPMFSLSVLIAEAVTALALNIYWREAWFGPMLSLINQVG